MFLYISINFLSKSLILMKKAHPNKNLYVAESGGWFDIGLDLFE